MVSETLGVGGGGLEVQEEEDPGLTSRMVILSQEEPPQVARAELAADLLEKVESEADRTGIEENYDRVDAERAPEPVTDGERFALMENAPDL